MSTLEPLADVDPLIAPIGNTFVIQQHHATALHHDFRLEMLNEQGSVLVSWAVPKGLPRRRGERHLAIRTPDHSMDHATFSGSIPGGEYGGGEVRIFDHGEYEMVGRTDDRITFRLEGERLAGIWHLVSTGRKDGKEQWLALMSKDLRPAGQERPPLEPMLATPAADAFDNPEWGFEPKWDGIRALAVCEEDTRLISRKNHDITVAYPELKRIHEHVVALDAVLDGELVAFDQGIPSFQMLQQRMHLRNQKHVEQLSLRIPVVFMVFDLIYMDGRDLTGQPLQERRLMLEEAIVPSDQIQISPAVVGDGIALFRAAAAQGMEGIMAKRLSSLYLPATRTRDWLKVKLKFDADVVIVGWTEGEGQRLGTIGSLMMAVYEGDELCYAGNVGTGFDRDTLHDLDERLQALDETKPPFPPEVLRSRPELRRAHWVSASLVAKVEHRQVTSAGRLRSPSFVGLRDDREPKECTLDQFNH